MSEISWTRLGQIGARKDTSPSPTHDEVLRLFGELRTPVLRYLHALGLPASDGEDVVQEAFLALFRHLQQEKPRDNLHGWVFRVSRNIALKRMRRDSASTGMTGGLAGVADPAANPEQLAVLDEQNRCVRAVVSALPDLDRQCLYLRAEGLRYREIAVILEISLGSVAQILSRSLDKLARAAQK